MEIKPEVKPPDTPPQGSQVKEEEEAEAEEEKVLLPTHVPRPAPRNVFVLGATSTDTAWKWGWVKHVACFHPRSGSYYATLTRLPEGLSVPPESRDYSGITPEMVRSNALPTTEEAFEGVYDFIQQTCTEQQQLSGKELGAPVLVAHWGTAIEFPAMASFLARLKLPRAFPASWCYLDTCKLAQDYGLGTGSQVDLAARFGQTPPQAGRHDGLAKARLVAGFCPGLLEKCVGRKLSNERGKWPSSTALAETLQRAGYCKWMGRLERYNVHGVSCIKYEP